jgi:hypothetical protein
MRGDQTHQEKRRFISPLIHVRFWNAMNTPYLHRWITPFLAFTLVSIANAGVHFGNCIKIGFLIRQCGVRRKQAADRTSGITKCKAR